MNTLNITKIKELILEMDKFMDVDNLSVKMPRPHLKEEDPEAYRVLMRMWKEFKEVREIEKKHAARISEFLRITLSDHRYETRTIQLERNK
jgi:hypothetical protein